MDWRERVVELEDKKGNVLPFGEPLQFVGAPLEDLAPGPDGFCNQLKKAFIPVCSNEEASRDSLFTSSSDVVIYLIEQDVLKNISGSMNTALSRKVRSKAFQIETENTAFLKRFGMTC